MWGLGSGYLAGRDKPASQSPRGPTTPSTIRSNAYVRQRTSGEPTAGGGRGRFHTAARLWHPCLAIDLKSDTQGRRGEQFSGKEKPEISRALWECGNRAFGGFQGRW